MTSRARTSRFSSGDPDGRHLVLDVGAAASATYGAERALVAYNFETDSAETLFEVTGVNSEATVSPDGAMLAYTSWDTGSPEIYLRPFLAPGRARRLTAGGARSPRWGANARELYYQTADGRIMVLQANAGTDLANATPQQLFLADGYSRTTFFDRGTSFGVTPDGQRFILRLRETERRAVLVQNWASLLDGGPAK